MAKVHRKDDLLVVQYVTGPKHVWLGVKFSRTCVAPVFVAHPPKGQCAHGDIDRDRLASAVVVAAQEFGLHPERIEYVTNDSPDYQTYGHCARLLASYAISEVS